MIVMAENRKSGYVQMIVGATSIIEKDDGYVEVLRDGQYAGLFRPPTDLITILPNQDDV